MLVTSRVSGAHPYICDSPGSCVASLWLRWAWAGGFGRRGAVRGALKGTLHLLRQPRETPPTVSQSTTTRIMRALMTEMDVQALTQVDRMLFFQCAAAAFEVWPSPLLHFPACLCRRLRQRGRMSLQRQRIAGCLR